MQVVFLCFTLLTFLIVCGSTPTLIFPSKSTDYCQIRFTNSFGCRFVYSTDVQSLFNMSIATADGAEPAFSPSSYTLTGAVGNNTFEGFVINGGVPTGTYIVTVTDLTTSVSVSQDFLLVSGIVSILSPVATSVWRAGSTHTVSWLRFPVVSQIVTIEYSDDGGNTFIVAATGVTGTQVTYSAPTQSVYEPVITSQFQYSWVLPASLVAGPLLLRLSETQVDPSNRFLSPPFLASNFSLAWNSVQGIYQGIETRYVNDSSGKCVVFTCPYVTINISSSLFILTYPPNSPCVASGAASTTVSNLASASYDGVYILNDASGTCNTLVLNTAGSTTTLVINALQSGTVCPSANPGISCGEFDLYSSITLTKTANPFANLVGKWSGSVAYAIPDKYGGCVQGSCSGLSLTYSNDGVYTKTYPSGCGAAVGSITGTIITSNYDGTFYQNPSSLACWRLVAAGSAIYASIGQVCTLRIYFIM